MTTTRTRDFLDTRNTISTWNFHGRGADWDPWRAEFAAYVDVATTGAHQDVAAEKKSFIKKEGLDAAELSISKILRAVSNTKCNEKVLSLAILVPRHGFKA